MSAETEYIRGKYEERNGALVRRAPARFDERGNDVWAERSGRTYVGGFGAPDISPVSGNGMGNISRLVGGKRGKKGGARGSTGTVYSKTNIATPTVSKSWTEAEREAHNQRAGNTKQFKSVQQMRQETNMKRKMEAINNPKTWQGKVLKGLAKAGDYAIPAVGYMTGIPGLSSGLEHLFRYVPGSAHYNPMLGESKEARELAAREGTKATATAAAKNLSGLDTAETILNAAKYAKRALGRGRGGASPDLATRNLLSQGEARYEGDADMMGGCYDCDSSSSGGSCDSMEGGARMKKKRLTAMEKEALQIAAGAARMNMSLEAHLKHHKVPAAKRRTIMKRVANAHAKGH